MLNLFFVRIFGFIVSILSILLILTGVESEGDVDRLRVAMILIFSSFNFLFPVHKVDLSAVTLAWLVAASFSFRLPYG